jgi:hypothetical protein
MSQLSESGDSARAILQAGSEILMQAEQLLDLIDDAAYSQPVEAAFNVTLGAHMRHCIDHFTSFLAGVTETRINYDHRERDTRLETDQEFARERIGDIRDSLARLTPASLSRPSSTTCKVRYAGEFSQSAGTTFARELMYVVAHAMHHFALMRIMGNLLKLDFPADFGVAPSTLAYQSLAAPTPKPTFTSAEA